ncbi:NAD(P)/FAD-dependent oxidoreductase [Pararhodobacter oceanensis]|uniref:NAD(P)/FAD-dependent oxidoreductase n=1 Tax=Pararhodobacter oceanensis TaxID=2172121 RepID=UPI003A94A8A0
MTTQGVSATPAHQVYDVVIVGGAIMGSSAAWFLTEAGFGGRILVVEKDPSYAQCSTAHTNSCMRQQFSNALNVQISQFAADFVKNLRARIGDDRVPELTIQNYGYLYLADNEGFADVLRANQKVQLAAGAETRLLSAEEIRAEYPFMQVDDILLGSINTKDEGYWDGGTVFDWWRRSARARGVEYISNEVVAMTRKGARVESVTLASGEVVGCGTVVNASGPRAARTAKMAGIELPVEPRKRYTWIFTAETPLDRDLPLTIDPSGVHMRQDGPTTYMVGSRGEPDPAVEPDDFAMDHNLWEEHIWPIVATRIPQFEAIRLVTEWAGHYAYNSLDQNAVLGPHVEVENFIFLNGFSGHGLQQSAAMGRGVAELITHGAYQTLDLTPFSYARIAAGQPMIEQAVI